MRAGLTLAFEPVLEFAEPACEPSQDDNPGTNDHDPPAHGMDNVQQSGQECPFGRNGHAEQPGQDPRNQGNYANPREEGKLAPDAIMKLHEAATDVSIMFPDVCAVEYLEAAQEAEAASSVTDIARIAIFVVTIGFNSHQNPPLS